MFSWCDGLKRWSRCACVKMRFDTLSAKRANKALVPPITRQACGLDHKPKTAITATPHDQVCAPRRHFVIHYCSFHTFWPKLIGSSLFCITGATWFTEPLHVSRERQCNVLGRFEICWPNSLDFRKAILASNLRRRVECSFKWRVDLHWKANR